MAVGFGVAVPKGKTRKQLKAKRARQEAAVKKLVRAVCVERDGFCRVGAMGWAKACRGVSEWAHLEGQRRARTRGQALEIRHTTHSTAMLCTFHHAAYDAHKFSFRMGLRGADGDMEIV